MRVEIAYVMMICVKFVLGKALPENTCGSACNLNNLVDDDTCFTITLFCYTPY